MGLILAAIYYIERRGPQQVASLHWQTAIFRDGTLPACRLDNVEVGGWRATAMERSSLRGYSC